MKLTRISPNFHVFTLSNDVEIYFSYETPIAFLTSEGVLVSENVWSRTTGKHINWIKNNRNITQVPNEEFSEQLDRYYN